MTVALRLVYEEKKNISVEEKEREREREGEKEL